VLVVNYKEPKILFGDNKKQARNGAEIEGPRGWWMRWKNNCGWSIRVYWGEGGGDGYVYTYYKFRGNGVLFLRPRFV